MNSGGWHERQIMQRVTLGAPAARIGKRARSWSRPQLLQAAAAATALASAGGANAQISEAVPPPRAASVSPTGVVYQNGSYQFSRELLSVGSGEFPGRMGFSIYYNSDSDAELAIAKKTTHNWLAYIYVTVIDRGEGTNPSEWFCAFHVVIGNRSDTFEKYGCGSIGTFEGGEYRGTTLTYAAGTYTYTQKTGATITFTAVDGSYHRAHKWSEPDGTQLTFGYTSGALTSVFSNRGYGLLFENGSATTKICAVSLTESYFVNGSMCPASAPAATVARSNNLLSSITDASGATWTFQYRGATDYISCYKEPDASVCAVTNSWAGSDYRVDRITSQLLADNSSISYGYATTRNPLKTDVDITPYINLQTTTTDSKSQVTTLYFGQGMANLQPTWVKDPLLYRTDLTYDAMSNLTGIKYPEANETTSVLDDRFNITQRRHKAKPNSGLSDSVITATYPATTSPLGSFPTCTPAKSCNKPTTITDTRGGVTDYTYDPAHGGVLTEAAPAVNGVRPVKRYDYEQRYAWIKNSAGGYSQAETPVWVLVREKRCRTTATVNTSCAGGAADEVVTEYDYGPNSGPNNLLVRGMTVTADGQTLRTCYGYDVNGRKISETKPLAGLASCL